MIAGMTERAVRDVIANAIERVATDDLGTTEDFYTYGLDSLDHAQILMAIEEAFGLPIAEAEVEGCRSIQAILDLAARPVEPTC